MKRKIGIVAAAILPLILTACVKEKYCEIVLEREWFLASSLRQGVFDYAVQRPTPEEQEGLRTVIRRCGYGRTHFEVGADPIDDAVVDSVTTILLAVELDDASVLDQLVAAGHRYDGLPNSYGLSTLAFATYREAGNAFSWALKNGVDPNQADLDGHRPLMAAAARPQDRVQSIEALIAAGAEIDAVSNDGRTALSTAIGMEKFDNALMLINAGADYDLAKAHLLERAVAAPGDAAYFRTSKILEAFESRLANRAAE